MKSHECEQNRPVRPDKRPMKSTTQIQSTRLQRLNSQRPAKGKYVLYWIQQSQRAEYNHALEYAVQQANELQLPLLVGFGLMDGYPEANWRHYRFMLEGLRETEQALGRRGIRLVVQQGNPDEVALRLGKEAALIVCDRGYLRHQKQWRQRVADRAKCEMVQVEADAVVPVEVASEKAEIAARTLRPKIRRHLGEYLTELRPTSPDHGSMGLKIKGMDLTNLDRALSKLRLDRSIMPVSLFQGGTSEARKLFKRFIREKLEGYDLHRNQPETDYLSHMGMYLHFGQISPLYLAQQIMNGGDKPEEDRDCFLEELLVRRELSQNFVHYTQDYDRFTCLPPWARATLGAHKKDERPYRYSRAQLEAAGTHDPYWNAAMREMKYTGYMHNYMRMYWGKKILEWSPTPEYAYEVTLALNNKYFIDGRDPASFASVAWVFGLHDRPWPERVIFGKIRFMSASGLERKADPAAYIKKVDGLVARVEENSRLT